MNGKSVWLNIGFVVLGLTIWLQDSAGSSEIESVPGRGAGDEESNGVSSKVNEGAAFRGIAEVNSARFADGGYLPDLYKFDPDWNYNMNRPLREGDTYKPSTTSPEKEALFKLLEDPARPGYPETADQLLLTDEALPQFELWMQAILDKGNSEGKGLDVAGHLDAGGGKSDQDFAKGLLKLKEAYPEVAAIMNGVTLFNWWEAVRIIAEASDPPTDAPRKLWRYRGTEFDPTVNGGKGNLKDPPESK